MERGEDDVNTVLICEIKAEHNWVWAMDQWWSCCLVCMRPYVQSLERKAKKQRLVEEKEETEHT